MLNVLFEMLNEEQFQYKCVNGKSVFANIALLLRLGLMKARESKEDEKAMTMVKSYIISYLFPKAVNASLGFLSSELTLMYLDIIA